MKSSQAALMPGLNFAAKMNKNDVSFDKVDDKNKVGDYPRLLNVCDNEIDWQGNNEMSGLSAVIEMAHA